ncbi:GNAT family N-acetyltransferase [Paenibacillus sp. TRM 82003]|nr:GNAT family N-acetyltransferase [Paenibacillus sp. TRM 82003]
MIHYKEMDIKEVHKLCEIDRSEYIDLIYKMEEGQLVEVNNSGHECPSWTDEMLTEIESRYVHELEHGGLAIGAYDQERLVGFGVLAHKFRGQSNDQLQVDLMYVSRTYRRQGIGTRILEKLSNEARRRGAKFIYISSTETKSAVSFYTSNGSLITDQVDDELFEKEPLDIHMIKSLMKA